MPDVREIPDDVESIASTAGDDHNIELLLAGFRACAKEAIRFLLEEEGLAPDHELPTGLQEHLDRQQNHLVGMLQNDSGLGMDDNYCLSSAEESFLMSGTECSGAATTMVDHELDTGIQEHLDRQQHHLAGMLQNDSRLGMDDNYCLSSDESFLISGTSGIECNGAATTMVDSSSLSNASTESVPQKDTGHTVLEPPVRNSSP